MALSSKIAEQPTKKVVQPKTPFFQAKLTVNEPGDRYEQEADAVADKVMRMPTPSVSHDKMQLKPITLSQISRKCAACEKEEEDHIQRKESGGMMASSNIESRLSATKGSGSNLSDATRTQMGSAIGADFSNVRIHTGGEAVQLSRDLNAHAFTHGSDVYFNAGKFAPNTEGGQHLLAHELVHTVQQGKDMQRTIQRVDIGSLPFGMYVERFEDFIYDMDYRYQGGNLSKFLTVRYPDGNVIDINIDSIIDDGDASLTAEHMRNGYIGDAGRIFPREMNRYTTPGLFAAKREAIRIMEEFNVQFILGSLQAVIFVLSLTGGAGIGSRPVRTPLTRRPLGLLATSGRFSIDAGRSLSTEEWVIARQLVREGRTVRAAAESTAQGVRSADFIVDGIRTELKTVSNITSSDISAALSRTIRDGAGQGSRIIINGRGQQGLTREVALRAIRRFFGAETQGRVQQVRILGSDFDLTVLRTTQ